MMQIEADTAKEPRESLNGERETDGKEGKRENVASVQCDASTQSIKAGEIREREKG